MSNHIDVLTKTMVKKVDDKNIYALNEKKELIEIPYGLLIWATGNTGACRTWRQRSYAHAGPQLATSRKSS